MITSFSQGILQRKIERLVPVIPDFKRISPKHGDLFQGRDYIEDAKLLADLGAPVFSVVTEGRYFGGSLELLEEVVKATGRPVLRKDFIQNTDDLRETKNCGAAAILLMCSMLEEERLIELYQAAVETGLEPLVETHCFEHMKIVEKIGASLAGINNKDIRELEKDEGTVATTEKLAGYVPENAVLISESGIHTPADVRAVVISGADAALVGTALWKADCLAEFYMSLSEAGRGVL